MANIEAVAHDIHKAIKGLGTDDKKLIAAITSCSNDQLIHVARVYKEKHHKHMIDDIKGDTSGDYRDLLVGLCTPISEYRAGVLKSAIAGVGTDEGALVDVLAHASNMEIQVLNDAYSHLYSKKAVDDIKGDTSGHFKKALENILGGRRNEGMPYNPAQVESDAHELHKKGEGKIGTDDDHFVKFFTLNPFPHIYEVDKAYKSKHGHDLRKACEKELSGDFLRLMVAIATPKAEYWANRIHHAIAGAGTKDNLLKRAFILNTPQELTAIGHAYKNIHGKSMSEMVAKDTSGNYKNALEALCRRAGI